MSAAVFLLKEQVARIEARIDSLSAEAAEYDRLATETRAQIQKLSVDAAAFTKAISYLTAVPPVVTGDAPNERQD